MKRIVSFDFDKTLFDHNTQRIPASALRALEELRKNGTIIVLATGRDMDNYYSRPHLAEVRPDARIDQNGAKVVVGDKVLYEHFMDKKLLRAMMDYAKEHNVGFGTTIGNDDYYVNPHKIYDAEMSRWGECGRQFRDPEKLLEIPVRTVAFIGSNAEAAAMEKAFPSVTLRVFSIDYGADVIENGFSKAAGLRCLCEHFGVPMSETYAFGDSMNDYEIIKEAAVGIAMGNGREDLKKAADYVTADIADGGIWKACLHFGLI